MKKRCLKLFICFLATISVFLFNNSVKADETIDINVNGKPGTGGDDPCNKFSYVCIYNYAAFKVTHYKSSGGKTTKIYYTSGYENNPFNARDLQKTKSRFDSEGKIAYIPISFKKIGIGNVSKKFTSTSNQKIYKKIINLLKNKNSELTQRIMDDFKIDVTKIKSYENDYFFVEPLFYMKMQSARRVRDLHLRKEKKPNFKYYYGTAYGIAKQVKDQYDICVDQIHDNGECDKAYKSRKGKGHVSRMGNSMRTTKKVTAGSGSFTLNKAPLVVKDKTRMEELAKKNKGYGTASISFKVYIEPEPKKVPKSCYSYEEKNYDPTCESDAENYQKKIGAITANPEGKAATSCTDKKLKDGSEYESQSEYGKAMNRIGGEKIGEYCDLYCTKDNVFYTQFDKIVHAKEISPIPSLENSSDEYSQNFKITKKESYECHVDLKKYYGDYSVPDAWISTLPDGNTAEAAYEISQANDDLTKGIELANAIGDLEEREAKKAAAKNEFAQTGKKIIDELNKCLLTTVSESDFRDENFSNDNIEVFVDGEKKSINPVYIIQGEVENAKTNIKRSSLGSEPKVSDIDTNGGEYLKYIQEQIKKITQRKEITYDKEIDYKLQNTIKYELNLKSNSSSDDEKGYADVDDDINDNSVCDVKEKLHENGKTKNESTITIFDGNNKANNTKYVCNKLEYSNNITAACPANTYHAGTNAYYWLIYDKLKDDDSKWQAMNGITKADAIARYCNDASLPKFNGGYEPIIEDGKVLDDCLMAGYSSADCKADIKDYYCTDLKGIETDIGYWVYLEAKKKKVDIKNSNEMSYILAQVSSKNPACTNACYEKNKPKGFAYRSISLGNKTEAFPGKNGNGRTPGANWDSDDVIKTAITDTKTVYNGNPMYKIVLNYKTIKNIRKNLNSRYSYDYIGRLKCNGNNAACRDSTVHSDPTYYGFQDSKCKSVNSENFYSSSCVNYTIGGNNK